MNLKPRRMEEPEINVVSLIDVVLLLVVFFMLSATFLAEGRVRIHLPHAGDVPRGASEARAARDRRDAGGRLSGQRARADQCQPRHAARRAPEGSGQDRSGPVTIRADGRASHQAVITAMDVLGRIGFVEINIATVKTADPGQP